MKAYPFQIQICSEGMMGYNNNNAGMHMVWNRRYGEYDDLSYYDRYYTKRAADKKEVQNEHMEDKMSLSSSCKKISTKSNNNSKKQYFRSEQNVYDKKQVIDIHHFKELSHLVMANVMMLSIQKKIDIRGALDECERLMKEDFRTNPSPGRGLSWHPKLEYSFVFLSILADKLGCEVYDFFIDDEERRKRFVYNLLEEVDERDWDGYVEGDTGEAEMEISCFDYVYDMTTKLASAFENMPLAIEKRIYDEKVYYTISFGDLTVSEKTKDNYCIKGAYIWEEENGKLQEYTEHLILSNPEWIDK